MTTNLDFLSYDEITISPISKTITGEYTIELWVYLSPYITSPITFTSYDIHWNLHNRIQIKNSSNLLLINCYPFTDISNTDLYPEYSSISLNNKIWTSVRCGADIKNKKYFISSTEADITTDKVEIPWPDLVTPSVVS